MQINRNLSLIFWHKIFKMFFFNVLCMQFEMKQMLKMRVIGTSCTISMCYLIRGEQILDIKE